MSAERKTEEGTLDVDAAALLIAARTGLKVKPKSLYGWASRGILGYRKIVGRIVFDEATILKFCESTRVLAGHDASGGREIIA